MKKRERNKEKRAAALVARNAQHGFGFWKVLVALLLIVMGGVGAMMAYERHQYLDALLIPSDTVKGNAISTGDAELWTKLGRQLQDFRTDPFMGKEAVGILANLPRYRAITENAFSKANGLHIDYIANAHEETGIPEGDPSITASQNKTRDLLTNLNQDSTGIEGTYCTNLTIDCFLQEMTAGLQKIDPSITAQRAKELTYQNLIPTEATLAFLDAHHGASMTGLEMKDLHTAHNATLEQIKSGNYRYYLVEPTISEARSDMALARMITFMRTNNKQHGVIVLGYGHEPRIKETMSRIGIIANIYNVR